MKKMNEYKHHYAMKMRAYGSYKQIEKIKQFGGAARFVYNRMVAINNELYQFKQVGTYLEPVAERIRYLESVREHSELINAIPFLADVDSGLIANVRQNYNRAWKNYRDGNGDIPTFHKKRNSYSYQTNPHYNKDSIEFNDCMGFRFVDKTHIILPKIGKVRIKCSKKMINRVFDKAERLGTVTVTLDETGKVYISVQLASDEPFVEKYEKTGSINSFDLNISNFLTEYNGNVVDNPRYLKNAEKHLKDMQRSLSRKEKGSKNYNEQRMKLAKLHKHVANQRLNFQHELASDMLKNHDIIFAEDLKVKNMVKNHKLAKAISDVAWGQFLQIMTQKAEIHDKSFVKVNPSNTTQTCSECGHIMSGTEKIPLGKDDWICPNCNAHHIRDHNSAKNIMKKGLELLP